MNKQVLIRSPLCNGTIMKTENLRVKSEVRCYVHNNNRTNQKKKKSKSYSHVPAL